MRVNMLKMCLNWKVLAGLGAVGAGVYAFAPGLSASAVSLLLLAVCPLSMVVMMAAMNSGRGEREAPADNAAAARATPADSEDLEMKLRNSQGQERAVAEQMSVRSRDQRVSRS
jgi:hypothetical protein